MSTILLCPSCYKVENERNAAVALPSIEKFAPDIDEARTQSSYTVWMRCRMGGRCSGRFVSSSCVCAGSRLELKCVHM